MIIDPTSPIVAYFWTKVQKTETCWLWTGCHSKNKYGCVSFEGEKHAAHRFSYMLHYNDDPGELDVCHRCDVPLCVNPAHLWKGTRSENLRDMHVKGRWRREHNNGGRPCSIDLEELARIEKMIQEGESQKFIADCFGIGQMTVSRIVNGQHKLQRR